MLTAPPATIRPATLDDIADLDWFGAQGIDRVDLHASAAGDGIYRSLGFVDGRYPELRWTRGRSREPTASDQQ